MTKHPFPFARLTVISGAIFVCVSSEFLPTGILPEMAAELGVSESDIGLLVTVFAFTVVLSTVPLTRLTHRYPRKWLLVAMLAIFAVTNVLCALAPTYWVLVVARILGGLAHGVFWSVASPYAARLVRPSQVVRATSVTNAGGTLAFILGVPVGAAIGHAVGWRMSFVVMAALIVAFAVLVVLFLPPVEHRIPLATGEIALPTMKDPTIGLVALICAVTVLVMGGHNTFTTYIAPWLIAVPGIPEGQVASVLFLLGIGGAIGLVLAGVLGDRDPHLVLLIAIAAVAVSAVGIGLLGATGWPAFIPLAAWSIVIGVVPPLNHGLMMRDISPRLRDTAAAALTTAFNFAIGGGALLGAGVLAWQGVAALPWYFAGLAALAVVVLLVARRARARSRA